ESARAIFRERSILLARFIRVAEEPNEQLIDANSCFMRAMAATPRHHRAALGIQVELVVMRNVFIADTIRDAPIGATPEPTPAIIRGWIFRVNHAIDPSGATEEAARNAKDDFAILD